MLNAGSLIFAIIAGTFLILLPRRSAVIPILLAATYTTRLPVIELGLANLSVLRILVIVGVVRVLVRGERIAHGMNAIDGLLLAWATVLIGFSTFHLRDAWTFRIGMVLGELGVYFLFRTFVRDAEDVLRVFRILCISLVPLAVLLLLEKYTAHNYFLVMGATHHINMRDGHIRAYGPFAHPILAGTVGATCVGMALCLWRRHFVTAVIGLCAAAGIVVASTSTGPVMMSVCICCALLIWNVRNSLRSIRWATVAAIIALDAVMNDPVYFVMARIDITGSSTGWHRAQLIRSSLNHFDEWWAVGTDYTRHWMPTGIHANAFHTDITNHFLEMGVLGGVPLLIVFVLIVIAAFRAWARALHGRQALPPREGFLVWALGAMLFGHVVNFWSISLFDHSVIFFYLILAMIASVHRPVLKAAASRAVPVRSVPVRPVRPEWAMSRGLRLENRNRG